MASYTPPLTKPWKHRMFRFRNRMFQFLQASFQRLVFGGYYKSFPPSLLWRLLVPPTKILFLETLRPLPFTFKWSLSDLWEIQANGWVRSSLWALEHLSFVKQSSWHLLLLKVKPPRWLGVALELPRLWWAVRKFVKVCFTSERKEARASEVRKAVERDPT
jgi:hypothetical protein